MISLWLTYARLILAQARQSCLPELAVHFASDYNFAESLAIRVQWAQIHGNRHSPQTLV
jgi:hypothetical protein